MLLGTLEKGPWGGGGGGGVELHRGGGGGGGSEKLLGEYCRLRGACGESDRELPAPESSAGLPRCKHSSRSRLGFLMSLLPRLGSCVAFGRPLGGSPCFASSSAACRTRCPLS